MENIIEKLKNLKKIEPDKDYSQKSLAFILNSPKISPNKFFEISLLWQKTLTGLKLSTNVAIASILVLVIFISALYFNSVISPLILPGLDNSKISAEAQQINQSIDINLNEINYHKLSQEITQSTLEKISETAASSETIDILPSNEEQIDKLLEELVK